MSVDDNDEIANTRSAYRELSSPSGKLHLLIITDRVNDSSKSLSDFNCLTKALSARSRKLRFKTNSADS